MGLTMHLTLYVSDAIPPDVFEIEPISRLLSNFAGRLRPRMVIFVFAAPIGENQYAPLF